MAQSLKKDIPLPLCNRCHTPTTYYDPVTKLSYCDEKCRPLRLDYTELPRLGKLDPNGVFTLDMNKAMVLLTQKRYIVFTGKELQLSLQLLEGGEQVKGEIHPTQSQFVRVERGGLNVRVGLGINSVTYPLQTDAIDTIIIPSGAYHALVNASPTEDAVFYTIYGPPAHTKEEMAQDEADFRMFQ